MIITIGQWSFQLTGDEFKLSVPVPVGILTIILKQVKFTGGSWRLILSVSGETKVDIFINGGEING